MAVGGLHSPLSSVRTSELAMKGTEVENKNRSRARKESQDSGEKKAAKDTVQRERH